MARGGELAKVVGLGVCLDLSSMVPDSRPGTQRMFRICTSSSGWRNPIRRYEVSHIHLVLREAVR